ncbi:Flp pilus assembly complex ATPase component TadA [Candidatus Woesearchaeota archaeon]|nr:Flp pilus assembly complex ATPase component TadA [Candidatus Woesearchaeota archaeon]
MKYVIDTSIAIEGMISSLIKENSEVLIPNAVIAELEHQANQNKEIGFIGLEEIKKLQKLAKEEKIQLRFIGPRPTAMQIKYAKRGGEIDSMIREMAYAEDSTLLTADKVQALSAEAYGIKVELIKPKKELSKLSIEKYFDKSTMSVHIIAGCRVLAKRGSPGDWKLEKVSEKHLEDKEVENMAREIIEKTNLDPNSFIEISRKGSTVVQYHNYRIVIVKPPISDAWEITAVKPVKVLNLEDYNLSEDILNKLKSKARGVLIAGEVGSGKSTFAQALTEYYSANNNVVKTVESPRDLQLSKEITQYSKNFTSSEEIHDILFLSRPDYIIFDEIRDTPDFKLYTDLRLGGSNCLGVIHAAAPIDSVQRFLSRMELGTIPSVLDTIIYIGKGNIEQILTLRMSVKVPVGMTEADLARPVIEIVNYRTNEVEYEIYSYGEQTVIIPVTGKKVSKAAHKLAEAQIEAEFMKYAPNVRAEMVNDSRVIVYVPESSKGKIIGKEGQHITAIEKKLGISIDLKSLQEEYSDREDLDFDISESGKNIILNTNFKRKIVDVLVDGKYIFTANSSKKGVLKVSKKSTIGHIILDALDNNKKIEFK